MNRIVREHYPVANLPEDLREEFEGVETVTIVSASSPEAPNDKQYHSYEDMMAQIKAMSFKEMMADRQSRPEKYRGTVTIEEAVARIRALRDEWDDDR